MKPRTIIFRRVISAPAPVEKRVGAVPVRTAADAALAWSSTLPSQPDAARGLLTTLRAGGPVKPPELRLERKAGPLAKAANAYIKVTDRTVKAIDSTPNALREFDERLRLEAQLNAKRAGKWAGERRPARKWWK